MASTVMAWKMAVVVMSIRLKTWVPRLPVPAEGVLPGDPALLVRGGAERQVGLAEQPVVGDDAVPGRVDTRKAGAHLPVHGDRGPGQDQRGEHDRVGAHDPLQRADPVPEIGADGLDGDVDHADVELHDRDPSEAATGPKLADVTGWIEQMHLGSTATADTFVPAARTGRNELLDAGDNAALA